jgi:hypothetical protein
VRLYRKCLSIDPGNKLAGEGLATILTDEGTRLKQAGQVSELDLQQDCVVGDFAGAGKGGRERGREHAVEEC